MDIEGANQKVVEKFLNSRPVLVGIGTALDTLPHMTNKTILHSGPPVTWERMAGPMKGAVIGALIYEGLAIDEKQAKSLAASGEITFDSCHHHDAVGPMAGVTSASMPVFIVENITYGNKAYCTLNEGLGKVLRFGAFGTEVIERLKWMEKVLGPALKEAVKIVGEIDVKNLQTQAMMMGDECHNRNRAGTSLFLREIAPGLVKSSLNKDEIAKVFEFINSNDHFFLNLSMAACKATADSAKGIKESTVVTTMARNGTDFGIRVAGLGDRWFTAPAEIVDGLYFPGFSEEDANPDIGDSVISETIGIGGFTMAAAPAIVQFVGGNVKDAINFTLSMYEITVTENNAYAVPYLDFRGAPTGIDIRRVIETGILPIINTGIAHKDPGIGQVGAGLVHPPFKCFEDALLAFAEEYGL